MRIHREERGVTLLDTVFAVAIMVVVFVGIASAFELSVDVVTNNKARAGAIALSDQRMEYIRSLPYTSVGTVGGIPSGIVPQSETVVLNGVTYTRRTFIEYEDDPKDGTGGSDTNGITEDYKAVKVDVAWTSRTGTRHITLVSRFEPAAGLETACSSCGTLTINVVNASSQPLQDASVSVVNASTSPAINLSTYTDTSGVASFIGAPAASNYAISVTEPGYSTAQTYSVTTQNTNPNPGNITVTNGQTTSATFAIDVLGSKNIYTWTPIQQGIWSDNFANASNVSTSSNITIAGNKAQLTGSATSGELQSITISPTALNQWGTLTTSDTRPAGTSIVYRVYDPTGTTLIPDSQLPGNAAGFSSGPINLSGVSTTTYIGVKLDAVFSGTGSATPSLNSWTLGYAYGPTILPNIAFTLQGAKTIGTGPSGTVYKYSQSFTSGANAAVAALSLEWDSYTVAVNGASTGYDISSSCPSPQPITLSPGTTESDNLYLLPHTTNSLLVAVRSAATTAIVPGATVVLSRSGFVSTSTADSCGQSFFSGLTAATTYSVKVSASGYTTQTQTGVSVSGTSNYSISL